MSDETFHEIQLNGKQLVFLFMAGTVVAVVIFLCGVMVGRGVRAQRGAELAESSETPTDPTADVAPVTSGPAGEGTSPAMQEKLSYPERLGAQEPPPETLKEQPPDPTVPTPVGSSSAPAGSSGGTPTGSKTVPHESGAGFTVQVAAVRERNEAETIVKRLTSKGYPAYVTTPAAGAPRVYRVRVGTFDERRKAEAVAGRLEKEEQFRPWITR
jgi:cell division septation protein DedD